MNDQTQVAVTSRSFSRNLNLREELLCRYKNVIFNDKGLKLEGDSLVDFLQGSSKAITALEKIDRNILSRLPELKLISKYGVGIDMIDANAMTEFNVKLSWEGGVNRRSVSELVVSFAISLLREVPMANKEVISGIWRQHVGNYLSESVFGIIGCGFIGKDLVKLLQPFNCKILVYDLIDYKDFNIRNNISFVSLEELLSKSDIVSIHTPLDQSTRNLLSYSKLALMKSTAILINTARGGLLDELALKKMLIDGKLHAAAIDVFETEPPDDKELLELKNVIVTPHIAGSANEAILAMGRAAINGLG
jgi:phosphoglycerate dehydrogenase-like enzyme